MKTEDNLTIFPIAKELHDACLREEGCRVSEGLTLRDFFAALCMQAAASHVRIQANEAEEAYRAADAMLKARKK